MKMTKNILYSVIAGLLLIATIIIAPYGERYQGMSGYIYEYGVIADISSVIFAIISLILISLVCINILYKIEDNKK